MFSPDDTIVAVATAAGRAALGVVRISGPDALAIASRLLALRRALEPRLAAFARLASAADRESTVHDEVIATSFPAPASFTGQDVVEISAHGSPVVLRGIVQRALAAGARLAEPGEFTLRAFLAGKLDLVQAEAVGDLVAAVTPLQARVAYDQLEGTLTRRMAAIDARLFDLIVRLEASLDFPDEGYHFVAPDDVLTSMQVILASIDALLADAGRGRLIRDGATVVIAGRPNVGKSSLFNALAGAERAIVTPVPGTTRDLVTELVDLEGVAVTLVDTAGAHDTVDLVEREGVARGASARSVANLVLVVFDGSEPLTEDDRTLLGETTSLPRLIVANKADRARVPMDLAGPSPLPVSALTGTGLQELREAIVRVLAGGAESRDTAAISNVRHTRLLEDARADVARAVAHLREDRAPEEFLLIDLQSARRAFDEIVGRRTAEDVLARIFERFCIGK
jgi:tRNA modification GTPase